MGGEREGKKGSRKVYRRKGEREKQLI